MGRQLKIDDFAMVRTVADPRLSPDGKRVAFTVTRQDLDDDAWLSEIFVADLDGSAPRQFTQRAAGSPRWSPDGRSLAYCARVDKSMQLVVAPLEGGEPRVLTDGDRTPITPAWSPDGTKIAFARRTADPKPESAAERNAPRVVTGLRDRLDGVGVFRSTRPQLFVIDVASGDTTQLTRGDFDCTDPAWSPDGSTIAFVSDRRRQRRDQHFRGDVYTVPADGGRAKKVTSGQGRFAQPVYSPDGARIATIGSLHGDEHWIRHAAVIVVDADGATAYGTALDRPAVAGTVGPTLAWVDEENLVAAYEDSGGCGLFRVSADPDAKPAPLLDGDRIVGAFDIDADTIVWTESWVDRFGEVYRAKRPDRGRVRSPVTVSAANAELHDAIDLRPATRRTHVADDGLEIESFVIEGRGRGTRPGVVSIHGGPFGAHPSSWPKEQFRGQALAAAGYTVVLPNPRGSTGYGEAFMQAVIGDLGGADYRDILGALDAAIDRGQVDADDTHVMGYSYGGYMSAWAVGHTRRFRSAVIGAPVIDFVSMTGGSDLVEYSVAIFEGTPGDQAERYREQSPITYAHKARTPSLIYVMDGDLRTPPSQADQFFTMLRLHGCQAELVRYPGGSHVGATPSQWADQIRRTVAWIDDHRR